jgi:hypothetical protein
LIGVKPKTAAAMLAETAVHVTEHDGIVDIDFESVPFIGNFAQVELLITASSITQVEGSYVMAGTASADDKAPQPVRLVTVAGSPVNRTMAEIKKNSKRPVKFDALVLFSLKIERDRDLKGRFSKSFPDKVGITASEFTVTYGIISRWRGKSFVDALPFFSKVNLRRCAHDLRRMGYNVSYKRI